MNKEKKKNKKTMAWIITMVLSVLALLLGIIGITFNSCSKDPEDPTNNGLIYDNNAVEGGWNQADVDDIVAGLNEKVEAGYINISMNTSPVFEDGTSAGNLMIVNETINNYPQKVVITRDDTQEVIYESAGIPVGSKIEKAKLNVELPKGTYACTAMFHNMDPETGDSLGCAGAAITITIKN